MLKNETKSETGSPVARGENSLRQGKKTPKRLPLDGRRLMALVFWLLLVGGYVWYIRQSGQAPGDVLAGLRDFLSTSFFGPIIYIVLYTFRPLVFFPATGLSVLGGYLYGPLLGLVYSSIGAILSATLAYSVGRFFGTGFFKPEDDASHFVARYTRFLRANGFEAVLLMRLIYMPYDLVNYLSGLVRVSLGGFVLATLLGNLPGSLTFVLFGSAIGAESSSGRWFLAGFSLVMLVVGIGLSRWLRKRRRDLNEDQPLAGLADEPEPVAVVSAGPGQ